MKREKIVIGTRKSDLALIYAHRVKDFLSKIYSQNVEIKKIVTSGDINQKERLSDLGGKGLFSKVIEDELIEKKIDIAVHALKDMPTIETDGLVTDCFLERNCSNEVLLSKEGCKLKDLKAKSIIGTSSFRREYQIKQKRNDLNFKLIRGNIDTRIKKLNDGYYDAIILAKAGVNSLKLNNLITEEFSTDELIPSAGQGVIAVQCREDDKEMIKLLKNINHEKTRICAKTEREVLRILGGDCSTAIGVISSIDDFKINLSAELFSADGKERYYLKGSKEIKFAYELGKEIGEALKDKSKGSYKK